MNNHIKSIHVIKVKQYHLDLIIQHVGYILPNF